MSSSVALPPNPSPSAEGDALGPTLGLRGLEGAYLALMPLLLIALFLLEARHPALLAAVAGLILLLVSGSFADGDTMGVMIAVLDSNFWLATHVLVCIACAVRLAEGVPTGNESDGFFVVHRHASKRFANVTR